MPDRRTGCGRASRRTRLAGHGGTRVFFERQGRRAGHTVAAARTGGWRLALAHGSTSLERLGALPPGALVARTIPQVALLAQTDLLIHHGGNGSLTEAAAAGVPMIVLPFSTDQFAAASAIERLGVGQALAPNTLTSPALLAAVDQLQAGGARERARELARSMAAEGGADAAVEAIAAGG